MPDSKLRADAKHTIYEMERNAAIVADRLVEAVTRHGSLKDPVAWGYAANRMGIRCYQLAEPAPEGFYMVPGADAPGIFYCKDLPPERICRGFCFCLAMQACGGLDCTGRCAECSLALRVSELLLPERQPACLSEGRIG